MAQMENAFNDLVKLIAERIKNDVLNNGIEGDKVLDKVYKAYNTYQVDERDCVDYIYNIEDTSDVIECFRGGLTTKDVASIYNESQTNTTKYFFFGCNHPKPELLTWEQFRELLLAELEQVLYAVIAFPWIDEYKPLYCEYIRDYLINNCFL